MGVRAAKRSFLGVAKVVVGVSCLVFCAHYFVHVEWHYGGIGALYQIAATDIDEHGGAAYLRAEYFRRNLGNHQRVHRALQHSHHQHDAQAVVVGSDTSISPPEVDGENAQPEAEQVQEENRSANAETKLIAKAGQIPTDSDRLDTLSSSHLRAIADEEEDGEQNDLKRLAVGSNAQANAGKARLDGTAPARIALAPANAKADVKGAKFPTFTDFRAQHQKPDSLPDIIHFTFEDSTESVELEGWEDEWLANATFNVTRWGGLKEPRIDFVYTWVNGSDKAFQDTIYPYELNSTMNDEAGQWMHEHGLNRYRSWDELRYSVRTVEKYASSFRNRIMLLVNAVVMEGVANLATPDEPAFIHDRQRPSWLSNSSAVDDHFEVLTQEDFFEHSESACLPTFNSLTIENQLYNIKSDTDRFFALSDDMLLGKEHTAADIYSPLFGPTMGFKTNSYNTKEAPTDLDARRFGEKPFLIYSSWLLNRRFGYRKRKGQVHFGHSLSRSVMREAIKSFPRPALQSTCQRFRGETGFQLYSWYIAFHYTMERHREALIWSYIMLRSDVNDDGIIDWEERQTIMHDVDSGMLNDDSSEFRRRMYLSVDEMHEAVKLQPPKVNLDTLWTSLDGPHHIKDIDCSEFDVNECLAPGFSTHASDKSHANPAFSSATIFERLTRQHPQCGDCLIKLILNRVRQGLGPLLPPNNMAAKRLVVIKALQKYQYSIIEPDALFMMVTDSEVVEKGIVRRFQKEHRPVGALCLNDDVTMTDPDALDELQQTMKKLFQFLAAEPSPYEQAE